MQQVFVYFLFTRRAQLCPFALYLFLEMRSYSSSPADALKFPSQGIRICLLIRMYQPCHDHYQKSTLQTGHSDFS